MSAKVEFCCVYRKTLYRNKDNGTTLFTVASKELPQYNDYKGELLCSGKIPNYVCDVPLKIRGTIGRRNRINISSIEEFSDNKLFTVKYLSGGIFKGIGQKTAERIVDVTGANIFAFLKDHENPAEVISKNVKSLSLERAEKLVEELLFNEEILALYQKLFDLGCSYGDCDALFDAYGLNAWNRLSAQPYEAGHTSGLPFPLRDLIARKFNFSAFCPERLTDICYEVLRSITNSGNSYGLINDIDKTAKYIIKNSAFNEDIPLIFLITTMAQLKGIVITNDNIDNEYRFYLSKIHKAENNICSQIGRLLTTATKLPYTSKYLDEAEDMLGIKYARSQKNCFKLLKKSGIKIITGGPGTGKSTVIKGLIYAYKKMYPDKKISLCAPTGRAAQRITETTGEEASTIHRLLDYSVVDGVATYRNEENRIDSDFIVVDEASMVDTEIFSLLLSAIKDDSLVILCGDTNQLPSVSSGNVLRDLMDSELISLVELDVTYRQKSDSSIIPNATNILKGVHNFIEDASFTVKKEKTISINSMITKIANRYKDSDNIHSIQFLSSVKKGDLGTSALNKRLQPIFNPDAKKLCYDDIGIIPGDKVMTIRNNYESEYYNGDIGIVKSINAKDIEIDINGKLVSVSNKDIKDVVLSYACTIHKAQGSEFDTVVVILPKAAGNMLDKKLLYTAVTRAKKNVIIISEEDSVNIAVHTNTTNKRKTSLCEFLLRSDFYAKGD